MPSTTVAIAPRICAMIRPANEIQAERTLSFFFFFFLISAALSVGAGATTVLAPSTAVGVCRCSLSMSARFSAWIGNRSERELEPQHAAPEARCGGSRPLRWIAHRVVHHVEL